MTIKEIWCNVCGQWHMLNTFTPCPERTNEPTRSPQEPFVQQSATADSEPNGVVVQGSMDEPDRKAFSVQQSALIAELKKFIKEDLEVSRHVGDISEVEDDESYDSGFYEGRVAECCRILHKIDELLEVEAKPILVEHEAKRAADC